MPSANIPVNTTKGPEFLARQTGQSHIPETQDLETQNSRNGTPVIQDDIAQALAAPEQMEIAEERPLPSETEPKMRKLKDFNSVAEMFSKFEFLMALTGTVLTGGDSDWLAYTHESFGEYGANNLASADEGRKELNPFVRGLFQVISFLFGIKTKDGKNLNTTKDFVKVQDKLIGALNMVTSMISGGVIAFKSLPEAIRGKEFKGLEIPGLHFVSTKILPLVNASLMWMSGAAKRRLAFDLQKDSYNKDNQAEIDGSFTSGSEDYICGANSAGLMLRQAIGVFSPKLATMLEPAFATWIAGSSFKAGYAAFKEVEEETPKFELSSLDKSGFGKGFYNLARTIAKPMGVELPELSTLAA